MALGYHGILGSAGIASAPFLAAVVLAATGAAWRWYYLVLTIPGLLLAMWLWLRLPHQPPEASAAAPATPAADGEDQLARARLGGGIGRHLGAPLRSSVLVERLHDQPGTAQKRNVHWNFADTFRSWGRNRRSSSSWIQPWLKAKKKSFPGCNVQRRRVCQPRFLDRLSYWIKAEMDSLDAAFDARARKFIELKHAIELAQFDMDQIMLNEPMDESALMDQFNKLETTRSNLSKERFQYYVQVRKLLGPDRFQKIKAFRKRIHKQNKEMRKQKKNRQQ